MVVGQSVIPSQTVMYEMLEIILLNRDSYKTAGAIFFAYYT